MESITKLYKDFLLKKIFFCFEKDLEISLVTKAADKNMKQIYRSLRFIAKSFISLVERVSNFLERITTAHMQVSYRCLGEFLNLAYINKLSAVNVRNRTH